MTFVQESREIENNTEEEQEQTKQEDGDQEDQVSPEKILKIFRRIFKILTTIWATMIFFNILQDFQEFDNDMSHQAPPIPRK